MRRRPWLWVLAVAALLAVGVWAGGQWLWNAMLEMHGQH